jgi:hypothetical protein
MRLVTRKPTTEHRTPFLARASLRSLLITAAATSRRQVLYEEGGPGAGINLYLDGGALYAGAWHLKAWPGPSLKHGGIEPGRWHHVAVVRDAPAKAQPDHLLLFVDGEKAEAGEAAALAAHPGDICIGWAGSTFYHDGKAGERSDAFAGRLDDVLVFSRALADPEVKGLASR